MTKQQNKSVIVAIIAMMFLFAMISFVTNMAAPFGTIWKSQYDWAGMVGNMMNFAAYLFMGIPAGIMITKIGYKKTALVALALGFIGICVQFLSSQFGADIALGKVMNLNYLIYLFGAFICGFCVCILNTVVNPMLNLLGGGGNRGNQFIQIGGSLNSLSATLTPMLAGMLIGEVTKNTSMTDVVPLLYIAMGIFALSFVIIFFTKIVEPEQDGGNLLGSVKGALGYRHLIFGVIAIFFYVGVEVGIPGEMLFYLSSKTDIPNATAVAGSIAAVYWFLMLIGRFTSSFISGKVSTRTQLITVSSVAIILLLLAIFIPEKVTVNIPVSAKAQEVATDSVANDSITAKDTFAVEAVAMTEEVVEQEVDTTIAENVEDSAIVAASATNEPETPSNRARVPLKCIFLILCGLCTSVMWGGIFNLATEGLGKYTAAASGLFMTMVIGGGVMPFLQDQLAGLIGYIPSYWLVVAMVVYILWYALMGSKPAKK